MLSDLIEDNYPVRTPDLFPTLPISHLMTSLSSLVPRPPQAFIACSMSLGRPGYEANLFPFHYNLQYEPGEAWV